MNASTYRKTQKAIEAAAMELSKIDMEGFNRRITEELYDPETTHRRFMKLIGLSWIADGVIRIKKIPFSKL